MADAIVARARACLGTRFRLQGRVPGLGLDCLGLVVAALADAGRVFECPRDYTLRGEGLVERARAGLAAAGGIRVGGVWRCGDVILFEPVPGAVHLAIVAEGGVIQAHLGVGRVVEGPADPAWAVCSVWRFGE